MTTVSEETREGSAPAQDASPDPAAGARAQARTSLTQPSSVSLDAITQCGRWIRARMARLLDRPESRPGYRPTFPGARDWHHKCADYYAAVPLVRWLRLAYGYAHLMLVKPVLDFTEWFTESPARGLVTVAVAVIIWKGR